MTTRREDQSAGVAAAIGAYARLVRVPNLFTAPPDVVLGGALAVGLARPVAWSALAGVAFASVLLYAAGTTLNDYADRAEDAEQRPERPIPAGDVAPRRALTFGVALLLGGVLVAALAGGPVAGGVAAVLAGLIACYDGWLKGSPVGFLCMGAARGTNVLLGASVAVLPEALPPVAPEAAAVPVVVALYVAAVTYMAEFESDRGERGPVLVAGAGAALATLSIPLLVTLRPPPTAETVAALALGGGFAAWTGRALRRAYADPSPGTVGPAVGTCVLALVVLDAAFAAAAGLEWALAALAFLVPAVGLAALFDVS